MPISREEFEQRYAERIKTEENKLLSEKKKQYNDRKESERKEKRKKTITIALCAVAIFGVAFGFLLTQYVIPFVYYRQAAAAQAAGDYELAIVKYTDAEDFLDARQRRNSLYYAKAEAFLAAGEKGRAMLAFRSARDYSDARSRVKAMRTKVFCGYNETILMDQNGYIYPVGRYPTFSDRIKSFDDIIDVGLGTINAVAVRADGTVVSNDNDYYVPGWREIIDAACGDNHIVGLKRDGTVVVEKRSISKYVNTYYNSESVQHWKDIVKIVANDDYVIGLDKNGVMYTAGRGKYGELDGIRQISSAFDVESGSGLTLVLLPEGTVKAAGSDEVELELVSEWDDIVDIAAGHFFGAGLKSDGTVVVVGTKRETEGDKKLKKAEKWTDIVAIEAGEYHLVGLKADGSVVAVGENSYGQCNVPRVNLFDE